MSPAVNYVRQGAKIGGRLGGASGAVIGGAAGAFPSTHIDHTGKKKKRTLEQRLGGAAIGAGSGGYLGYSSGRLAGALHHANKWFNKGYRPPGALPDWLKGAKTKAEGRKLYHAQVRKMHPDLHPENRWDSSSFRKITDEWKAQEPHLKTAMLAAFANEIEKISTIGAILGGAAGYKISPNTHKGKLMGALVGAGIGHAAQGVGNLAKRKLVDEPHMREQQELYGYQPVAQSLVQGQNHY